MDEDMKTLLAILALLYGSTNGVGLFKPALEPVKKQAQEVDAWVKGAATAVAVVCGGMKALFRELWSLGVLVYVVLSIVPAIFIALVVRYGAHDALLKIGLGSATRTGAVPGQSPFYWILFALSVLTAWQLLVDYRKAWGTLVRAWLWARKQGS